METGRHCNSLRLLAEMVGLQMGLARLGDAGAPENPAPADLYDCVYCALRDAVYGSVSINASGARPNRKGAEGLCQMFEIGGVSTRSAAGHAGAPSFEGRRI